MTAIEYRILFHKGNVILAENKNDYIVGIDYDETQPKGSQWGHGLYFGKTVEGLTSALETFRIRTEKNYIARSRLEELATQFKDCALEDEDLAYVIDNMDESEIEFFGLNEVKGDIL
jgi:hypothetical protein